MIQLSFEGKIIDVPKDAALTWAMSHMVSPLELIGGIHWTLSLGLPSDPALEFLKLLEGNVKALSENASIIIEPILESAITRLLPPLRSFIKSSREVLHWQDMNITNEEKAEHHQIVDESGPCYPPWSENKEYQLYIESLNSSYLGHINILSSIIDQLSILAKRINSTEAIRQLHSAKIGIPFAEQIIELGYQEAIRRNSMDFDHV